MKKVEVINLIKKGEMSIWLTPDDLLKDREVATTLVTIDGNILENLEDFQDDYEIVKLAVSQNGEALKYASLRLKNHKRIVLKAIENYGCALAHANKRFQNNDEIVAKAIQQDEFAKHYSSLRIKEREVKCIKPYGNLYDYYG